VRVHISTRWINLNTTTTTTRLQLQLLLNLLLLHLPFLLIFGQIPQVSLTRQQGLVVVELDWPHPIACPPKPTIRCKYLEDISYTSWVIAHFVQNFIAMAMGVDEGRIWLAAFDGPSLKTPYRCKNLANSYTNQVYSPFCPKFHNGGVGQGQI